MRKGPGAHSAFSGLYMRIGWGTNGENVPAAATRT